MNTSQAVETFKYIQEQPEIIKVISRTFQQIVMSLPLPRGDRRLRSSCKKGCNGDAARKVLNLFLFKCMDIFSVTAPTVFIPTVKASLTHTRPHADTPFKHTQSQRGGRMCQQLEEKQGEGICVL